MENIDILIVGAGTAGMPCAITAAEGGARVAVVEKTAELGGTLHISAGQMSAAGSRVQREREIEDSPQDHFDDIMRIGHGHADPELLRQAVTEAAATLDWLDGLDFPFPSDMPIIYYGHDPYSRARTIWGAEMGVSILKVVQPRFEELVERGSIELHAEHRLERLLFEEGRVVGVGGTSASGAFELRASNVVLTTGGYAANRTLFSELHPDVHCLLGARPSSTGDGMQAAREIGADIRGADHHLPTPGCIELTPGSGETDIWDAFANAMPQYRTIKEVHVNASGERFQREDEPSADARERALAAQGGRAWIVFDEAMLDDDDPVIVGWSADMVRDEATQGERVWKADSLPELAALAGIDVGGLVATIDAYNAGVRAGSDALGREQLDGEVATAPFYAIATHAGTVVGFAGLNVDGELNVLDQAGLPIPGLYAAGEAIGGAATMGDGYGGGMCVTPALSFGRILGRRLAALAPTR
jgi:fumarate reductase flavoprotein subunit